MGDRVEIVFDLFGGGGCGEVHGHFFHAEGERPAWRGAVGGGWYICIGGYWSVDVELGFDISRRHASGLYL
ncbi:hypothetical protein D3C72_555770 [compost metagenome]